MPAINYLYIAVFYAANLLASGSSPMQNDFRHSDPQPEYVCTYEMIFANDFGQKESHFPRSADYSVAVAVIEMSAGPECAAAILADTAPYRSGSGNVRNSKITCTVGRTGVPDGYSHSVVSRETFENVSAHMLLPVIDRIEIDTDYGMQAGTYEKDNRYHMMGSHHYRDLSANGTTAFSGDFAVTNDSILSFMVKIIPVEYSGYSSCSQLVSESVDHDEILLITLWVNPILKFIDVTSCVRHITEYRSGEMALW